MVMEILSLKHKPYMYIVFAGVGGGNLQFKSSALQYMCIIGICSVSMHSELNIIQVHMYMYNVCVYL